MVFRSVDNIFVFLSLLSGNVLLLSTNSDMLLLQISVYSVPGKINQAEYALNTAVTLLDFYDEYFGIPYPLPKQGAYFKSVGDIHCDTLTKHAF